VLSFCRRTWGDYGDFIDRVWDEWAGDRRGFFAVAALGTRPIGTAKLTLLRPGEVWFEGLRVDREFRGLGLAQTLTDFLLNKAARMGARSVRYATGGSNLTSQHIGKSWGFDLLRRYTCMEAPPDGRRKPAVVRVTDPAKLLRLLEADSAAGGPAPRRAPPSRTQAAARLTHVLKSSRFATSMKGLASEGWTFYQIDEDFVRRALKRREFYAVMTGNPSGSGGAGKTGLSRVAGRSRSALAPGAAGLMVAAAQRRRGRLLVWTLADLLENCLPLLLGAARRLAFDSGLKEVRVVIPYARAFTIPARKAGFHQEYPGMSSVVMELAGQMDRTARVKQAGGAEERARLDRRKRTGHRPRTHTGHHGRKPGTAHESR
jgi:GNAT superfamily N-acetyltransferase